MASKRYFIRPTGRGETLYNVFDSESSASMRAVPVVEFVTKAQAEQQRDKLNAEHERQIAVKDARFRRSTAFRDSLSEEECTKRSSAQTVATWENNLLPNAAGHFLGELHGISVALHRYASYFEQIEEGLHQSLAGTEIRDKGEACFQAALNASREVRFLQQKLGLDTLFSDAKRVLDNQTVADSIREDFVEKYNEQPEVVVAQYEARRQAFYERYDQEHPTDA